MTRADPDDPKNLIFDSYQIEGITAEECRSIFMDWALSLPMDADANAKLTVLIDRYAAKAPDHPMTGILKEGLAKPTRTGRRGGRAARTNR